MIPRPKNPCRENINSRWQASIAQDVRPARRFGSRPACAGDATAARGPGPSAAGMAVGDGIGAGALHAQREFARLACGELLPRCVPTVKGTSPASTPLTVDGAIPAVLSRFNWCDTSVERRVNLISAPPGESMRGASHTPDGCASAHRLTISMAGAAEGCGSQQAVGQSRMAINRGVAALTCAFRLSHTTTSGALGCWWEAAEGCGSRLPSLLDRDRGGSEPGYNLGYNPGYRSELRLSWRKWASRMSAWGKRKNEQSSTRNLMFATKEGAVGR
jgi:hypothetical protein